MKAITVFRLSSLGDVAMLVPVLLSFHKQYPHVPIRLVTRAQFAPIFNGLDFVQIEVIHPHSGSISFFRLLRFSFKIALTRPHYVADMHDVLRTKVMLFFCRLLGAKVAKIDKGREEKRALIRPEGDKTKWLKSTCERYADVLGQLGFPFTLQPIFLARNQTSPTRKRIGISPFSKHSSKEYHWEKMQRLVALLAQHDTIQIYVFGYGPREKETALKIANGAQNVEVMIGKLNFAEELNLISSLDLMLSMDSGNGHLAANYGVPVVTLWGSTHPRLGFGPYMQPIENSLFPSAALYPQLPVSIYGKDVIPEYARAIDSISEDAIYSKVRTMLSLN